MQEIWRGRTKAATKLYLNHISRYLLVVVYRHTNEHCYVFGAYCDGISDDPTQKSVEDLIYKYVIFRQALKELVCFFCRYCNCNCWSFYDNLFISFLVPLPALYHNKIDLLFNLWLTKKLDQFSKNGLKSAFLDIGRVLFFMWFWKNAATMLKTRSTDDTTKSAFSGVFCLFTEILKISVRGIVFQRKNYNSKRLPVG